MLSMSKGFTKILFHLAHKVREDLLLSIDQDLVLKLLFLVLLAETGLCLHITPWATLVNQATHN